MPLTATIPETLATNGRNLSQEKELAWATSVVVNGPDGLSEPVVARWYCARRGDGMRPLYCTLWIHHPRHYGSGRGKASGCGYDKRSASLDSAIRSAGITLSRSISGTGETEPALLAIAEALCPGMPALIVSHG